MLTLSVNGLILVGLVLACLCGRLCIRRSLGKIHSFPFTLFPMRIVGRYLWFKRNEEIKLWANMEVCGNGCFLCCNMMPKVRMSVETLSLLGDWFNRAPKGPFTPNEIAEICGNASFLRFKAYSQRTKAGGESEKYKRS